MSVARATARTLRPDGADREVAPRGDILLLVADHPVPPEVLATAQERSRARAARDWSRADTLKASIEAAGWRVVDRGLTFRLWPALPPDIEDAGRLCYGTPDAVPSRMQEADEAGATILVTASAGSMAGSMAGSLADTLADLRRHAPLGTWLLVVVPREISPIGGGRRFGGRLDRDTVHGWSSHPSWTPTRSR